MKIKAIAKLEQQFDQSGINNQNIAHKLAPFSVEIDDPQSRLDAESELTLINAELASGDASYYYPDITPKDQIVLHYTAGYLPGDIATLTQHDYHVSVPFVIGRNGVIYQLFNPDYWAYHLGRKAHGGNKARSARSIGIELSNIGPLKRKGEQLQTIYGDVYCHRHDTDHYQQYNYRGYDYYASFTEAQYQALTLLLRYLTSRYDIPRRFLHEQQRYLDHPSIGDFAGIVSHANYRAGGKTDIGPAFNWFRLIENLEASTPFLRDPMHMQASG